MSVRLGPAERAESLSQMAERELDVLVVGGGVVGAGSALDAVTRGLRVGLVEMRDWASGTSSRSSKLIHGGLRYLEMLDFGLVREALRERGLLLDRIAPHLVRKVPFLYPLTHRFWERPYVGAGLMLYDTIGLSPSHPRGVPMHRHLSQRSVRRIVPGLKPEATKGALQYYDAQVDDARFVSTIVRTAASFGAYVANRTQAIGFLRDGERVIGARLRDVESGEEFDVRAKVVINAAGVWTDEIQQMVGGRGSLRVMASKGIHLVVPRDRIRSTTGMILRTEKSVLFVIPWGRHWIIGTTDTPWELDKSHPAATSTDIDYLLDHVNEVLVSPLTRDDVQGVYAGLRPLLVGESDETSKLSREHTVANPVPGLVMVAGGKYTTYRVMAADAVDAAVHSLGGPISPCITARVPLLGASGFQARWNQRHLLARESSLSVARIEHLLHRYGSLAEELLSMISSDPDLGRPLPGAEDYLAVEVAYAASHEGARHLTDILTRRTRISIETWDRGVSVAPVAADIAGEVLGWDADEKARQISVYLKRVEAERASQQELIDAAANAVRVEARDRYDVVSPA
ncbi:glycerol-3-phosphate dehydrogenase/oxidase [Propionibacteriaceae bacterium Y1685]|uniref:glycerol-3-phosphate dehydrogenase/oxidase n=1 Tax=Microlunatus sp. Y1700 TaxID=3418487 RepID=UPI003B82B31E